MNSTPKKATAYLRGLVLLLLKVYSKSPINPWFGVFKSVLITGYPILETYF